MGYDEVVRLAEKVQAVIEVGLDVKHGKRGVIDVEHLMIYRYDDAKIIISASGGLKIHLNSSVGELHNQDFSAHSAVEYDTYNVQGFDDSYVSMNFLHDHFSLWYGIQSKWDISHNILIPKDYTEEEYFQNSLVQVYRPEIDLFLSTVYAKYRGCGIRISGFIREFLLVYNILERNGYISQA